MGALLKYRKIPFVNEDGEILDTIDRNDLIRDRKNQVKIVLPSDKDDEKNKIVPDGKAE